MKIDAAGLDLIVRVERLKQKMYLDQAGYPTIGVGHLLSAKELDTGTVSINGQVVSWRGGLSVEQCMALLDQDADWAEKSVGLRVSTPLTQHQANALYSFVFNVGDDNFASSSVLRYVNLRRFSEVPSRMRLWNKVRHRITKKLVPSKGLDNRREQEIAMWEGR